MSKRDDSLITRREGSVRLEAFNEQERTVEVIWAAGAAVKRYSYAEGGFFMEELSMDPAHIRMNRFAAGMSFLDVHDAYSGMDMRLGTVVPSSVRIENGKGYARIKLSRNAKGEALFQDLRDGHGFPVSVGYKTHAYEKREGSESALPTLRAIDWEPMEISAVPVPADPGAHSRKEAARMPKIVNNPPPVDPADEDLEDVKVFGPTEKKRLLERVGLDNEFYTRNARKDESSFRAAVIDELASRSEKTRIFGYADVGHSFDDPAAIRERRIEALAARFGGPKPSDAAREFMNHRLVDHARWEIQVAGGNADRLTPDQVFSQRSHTTSDFPLLLQGVGNRILLNAYANAESPIKAVLARETTLPDFRPKMRLKLSGIGRLEKLNEAGEIKHSTRLETMESTSLETFAKGFTLSRKAKINDDLHAFSDWSTAAGRAAAETENALLFELLTQANGAGPVMGEDTKRLFHVDRGNLAASASALSLTTLSAARLALRTTKGFGERSNLNITPKYLVVGPLLETWAEQMLSATIVPNSQNNVNPFSGQISLLVVGEITDFSWYVFADPARFPVLEFAYLSSAPGPQTATQENFWTADTDFRCLLDFGVGATDWRGAYRNPGAALP